MPVALHPSHVCVSFNPEIGCCCCRWEGTPASNINITNNTVVDCPYDPQGSSPALSVYAGPDNLNATTPIQSNIMIAGNLIIGGVVRPLVCLASLSWCLISEREPGSESNRLCQHGRICLQGWNHGTQGCLLVAK